MCQSKILFKKLIYFGMGSFFNFTEAEEPGSVLRTRIKRTDGGYGWFLTLRSGQNQFNQWLDWNMELRRQFKLILYKNVNISAEVHQNWRFEPKEKVLKRA